MNRCPILFSCAIFSLASIVACSHDAHDHPNLVTGKQLFEYHCAECHQEAGTGKFLRGVPANKGTPLTASQIANKVRSEGKTGMPGFPGMSHEEAVKIAAYVKSL